jgi:hypothetical protein
MDENRRWFFYSQQHRNHLASITAGCFRKTWCKLDDGRVLEYTCTTVVGNQHGQDHFTDYEFLGEGVIHQK